MRKYFETLIANKEERLKKLKEKIAEASTADEVRSITAEADEIKEEIRSAKEQLAALPTEDEPPKTATTRGFNPLTVISKASTSEADVEYRTAFMNYVCRNVPIPAEFRQNQTIGTSDEGAVIPNTILNEIVEKLDSYGNILARVRKLNVQGGVSIPILTLKPTAAWVGESSGETQKITATSSVTFSYYGLEVKIAQTLLANIVALPMFEETFVRLSTEALVHKQELGIVKGTGVNQMLGITVDTRIPATNKITIDEADLTWTGWKKKFFSKIPKAYRNGIFIMSQGTFESRISGMTDTTGQPIGRVNYGIDGEETYRFAGKTVETVETDILDDYDNCSEGDVFAIFGNLSDYAINSNMQLTVKRWPDDDNNLIKTKVMLICDGKVVDPNGFFLLKKGAVITAETTSETPETQGENG